MFDLLQTARRQRLPTDVIVDLFDKMVLQIIMQGCEIQAYENLALLEKLNLKTIKFIVHLDLNKSTKTAIVYGESGRFP